MGANVGAILYKNFLLRKSSLVSTLMIVLLPPILIALMNYYYSVSDPVLFRYVSTLKYEQRNSAYHDELVLFQPDDENVKTIMWKAGSALGYKKSSIRPGPKNSSIEHVIYGIDVNLEGPRMKYSVYPRLSRWPHHVESIVEGSYSDYLENFLNHQFSIDSAFIFSQGGNPATSVNLTSIGVMNPDRGVYSLILIMSIFLLLSALAGNLIGAVVDEKETGAKELMLMMGVKNWESWLAKLLEGLILFTISLFLILIFLYIPLRSSSAVMITVNPTYFVIVGVVGFIPICWMLFWLSCFFDNANVASLLSSFLAVIALFLVFIIDLVDLAKWKHLLLCLHPFYSALSAAKLLSQFESLGKEVQMLENLSPKDGHLSLADFITMMVVDTVIFMVFTWYQNKVTPGQYGVPQPFGFFLNKSYWTQNKVTSETQPLAPNPASPDCGIKVKGLRKVFKVGGATTVAVDDVSMEVPKGQITALLGHNGAGKSTTMSIITGMIPASSGTVEVNGYDIRKNQSMARQSLGLCPQQDFLFRGLTSMQILTFYGMVKGLTRKEAIDESDDLLKRMKMSHAKNTLSQNLSGGMKRKVSLGIAIIGGSKVLVLDEPTSGVDPELRREISDLLLSYRGEKTIMITTHIMEEADAVSDHIVILDNGRVVCAGSPMELKLKFGTGYTLSVVVPNEVGRGDQILNLVKSIIPGSMFKARNVSTLTFQLPDVATPKFPTLFVGLDNIQKDGGLISYSVCISTLEDVFLRVREEEKMKMDTKVENLDDVDGSPYQALRMDEEQERRYSGFVLLGNQFSGLFVKKWLQFWRSLVEYSVYVGFALALILLFDVAQSKLPAYLSKEKQTSFEVLDGSMPLYPGMEVFVGFDSNCLQCANVASIFKTVSEERGFTATMVDDTEQAARNLYYQDYHKLSKYLLAAVNFKSEGVDIVFGAAAMNIMAINLVDTAMLQLKQGSGELATFLNLSYIGERDDFYDMLSISPMTITNVPVLSGLQTYFYMSALLVENANGAKELQLMVVPVSIYWLSHLLFDILTFIPYMIVVFIIYGTILDDPLLHDIGAIPIPLVLWSAGLIMMSYLITQFVKSKINAFAVAYVLYMLNASILYELASTNIIDEGWAYLYPSNLWRFYVKTGSDSYLLILLGYCVILFCLLIFIDCKVLGRVIHSILSKIRRVDFTPLIQVDSDVLEEEQKAAMLMSERPDNVRETLVASKLRRWYGIFKPRAAVRGVSFLVNPGECFGLLGVNGAGKSSTFNMLTGRISSSGGDAIIRRQHLKSYLRSKYLNQIGYCPQTTAVIPQLTGEEMLQLFARLRGFTPAEASRRIKYLLEVMDLQGCKNRRCGKYSGGMERKLSTAIAFLWNSPVVMLDEPTSGVDPVSRRCIWEAVTAAQKEGQAIVLTSHSMVECEVLCSRLAIMVDGSFRCIGETITLKNKFGAGYSVMIKIGPSSPTDISDLKNAVIDTFESRCTLTEHHCNILQYRVSEEGTTWGRLFGSLEGLKARFSFIESYTASETTLEEIFLTFAGKEPNGSQPEAEVVSFV